MNKNNGRTGEEPILDKSNHARCPYCKRFIQFDESIDEKENKWHIWECKSCGAFSEHFHSTYGVSSLKYDSTSKECYCGYSKGGSLNGL